MRYLNRIILINSAQVKYAEINLDGNIHFIGTQGAGKSTALRAILFFYNADTLKLGIAKEKKSYTDYYFQYPNSYIIYEVKRAEGNYCVVSYKSQNKICFRFFDGDYNKEIFISSNGEVATGWDGIAKQLDARNIFYTKRKIESYQEYRDILYGNNDGIKSEMKRYALLESKEYQNIPRTIQNVFLNSKLEAEFIKQTIIMSLENDIKIDLSSYSYHLGGFESQLNDIKKFRDNRTAAQANNISRLHIAIKYLEKEKLQLAKQLASALNNNKHKTPKLKEELGQVLEKEEALKVKQAKLTEAFKTKEKKIAGEISVFDERLKTAKRSMEQYEKINIHEIIQRVAKKESLEKEQTNLQEEKALLSAKFVELTQKFQSLLDRLDNQLKDFENTRQKEKLEIQTAFLQYKDETRKYFDKLKSEIQQSNKKETDIARSDYDERKQFTHSLRLKREGLKHKRFFEEEIKALETAIVNYRASIQKSNAENVQLQNEIDTLLFQGELEEKDLQKNFEREQEKLNFNLQELINKVEEIDLYINNSKNSLYGWLNDNYEGWENTIGKVVDEKVVLFNQNLSPALLQNKGNSFYGVELNLAEINKKVKTVADYKKERNHLSEKIHHVKDNVKKASDKLQDDIDKLKKRYQPKIREKKDLMKEAGYLLSQYQNQLDESLVKLNDYNANAEKEKKQALSQLEETIAAAVEEEIKAQQEIARAEERVHKILKSNERECDKKIDAENAAMQQKLNEIDAEIQVRKKDNDLRRKEIQQQQQNELSQKGADTTRLSAIDNKLAEIRPELLYIEQNRRKVFDYEKDKRELFDKTDEFKKQKENFEKQLEQEETKFNKQDESIKLNLDAVRTEIQNINAKLNVIKEDEDTFNEFKGSSCYSSIEEYLLYNDEEIKTDKRARILIDELKEIHYDKLTSRVEELRKDVTDFLGRFSDENIFQFKRQMPDTNAFLKFAEELSDFIEEDRIAVLEREVNERFSLIIRTIGKETTDLVSKEGEIQNVITKINRDFVERNFAGVIKKIELMLAPSKNEVVQLLRSIKEFNDENIFELGAANLFSSIDQDSKNKKAIDLLKQFVKKIGELKRDYITLADSFELKFRIEENNNDTGWVEKLSNVGSEGTDVLVKAMVNIMLLNVFKDGASRRFKEFKLHCMMDEIGKLHPNNVRGILKFANDRNILLINGSPTENDALAYKHIYRLEKDEKSFTRVKRILTQHTMA